MSCVPQSPGHGFAQSLRVKLANLEQELVEAHVREVQLLDNHSPSPHHPVCEQSPQSSNLNQLRFETGPLKAQTFLQKDMTCDDTQGFLTDRSHESLEARTKRERHIEACDSVQHANMHMVPDVAFNHPKVKVSFAALEPISTRGQDETPDWPETGDKAPGALQRDSVVSHAGSQIPIIKSDGENRFAGGDFQGLQPPFPLPKNKPKKRLSFANDAQSSQGSNVLSSGMFNTHSDGKHLKKAPRFQNISSPRFEAQDGTASCEHVKLDLSDSESDADLGPRTTDATGLSSLSSLTPKDLSFTLMSDGASHLLGDVGTGYLELDLRAQWQNSGAEVNSTKNKKFAMMVNQMLFPDQAPKDLERRSSIRSAFSHLSEARLWRAKCDGIINPFSKTWLTWELLGSAILLYDVVLVPMQGFDMPASVFLEAMDWFTITYWTLSFFFAFCISFQRDSEASLITDRWQIITHYIKGWFLFDFLVVGSDWASLAIEIIVHSSGSSLKSARVARLARLGRLFRILRLLRLMRLGEMMQKVERSIDSEYLSICFLILCNVLAIFALAHITACIWFAIGDASHHTSWLYVFELKDAEVGNQYMQSLGWSLSTLLGAQITIVLPVTVAEFICALCILLLGTITVSLVFSSTTAAMTRLQQLRAEHRNATFKLKAYLRQNKISRNLEARILRYCDIARSVHAKRIASEKVKLLDMLSGPLRLSLQVELHSPHLTSHPFFKMYHQTNAGAMGEPCLTAVSSIYLSRSDVLFQTFAIATNMFFLVSGVMVYRRAKGAKSPRRTIKIEKNTDFSEAALWSYWSHRGSMKSLIESQVLALDVMSFCRITETHHDVFFEASVYADKYVSRANNLIGEDKFVWDVSFELMYEEKQRFAILGSLGKQGPGFIDMLSQAEDVAAELMDAQSESDSDDERLFKASMHFTHQSRKTMTMTLSE